MLPAMRESRRPDAPLEATRRDLPQRTGLGRVLSKIEAACRLVGAFSYEIDLDGTAARSAFSAAFFFFLALLLLAVWIRLRHGASSATQARRSTPTCRP
jgi:hypothetical protein